MGMVHSLFVFDVFGRMFVHILDELSGMQLLGEILSWPWHRITLDQYTNACAVIMSRIQPWWGGSLVPFVDQANHSKEPHLEFRLSKVQVEGRALRVIEPGEVFQSYGNLSTADSLYSSLNKYFVDGMFFCPNRRWCKILTSMSALKN